MKEMELLSSSLRKNGYSITAPRQIVFDALISNGPLSTAELIKQIDSRIDRVSIYRTLKLFERLGIIQRLSFGFKYKLELTDRFTAHHHHLSCTNCGRIIDINEDQLESFVMDIASAEGFVPSAHQIEIQGRCQACQAVR